MRITNKIMQNNSLYNINNNKIAENDLSTQISTGKKIIRPSDDPVIAIRALRLRSTVNQLNQYYEKNASDAEKWLKVTEDSLKTITDVLTDAVKQATDGANKDLTLSDCETIITQIDSLTQEYYATGNVDYAGRYIFTGFRTETPLTFDDNSAAVYSNINDEFNYEDVEKVNRVIGLHKIDAGNTNTGIDPTDVYEHSVTQATVGRIQLSYEKLNSQDTSHYVLKYRENMDVPAVATKIEEISVPTKTTLTDNSTDPPTELEVFDPMPENAGDSQTVGAYTVTKNTDGTFTVDDGTDQIVLGPDGNVVSDTNTTRNVSSETEKREFQQVTLRMTPNDLTMELPAKVGDSITADGYTVVMNSDYTFTITQDSTDTDSAGMVYKNIIQLNKNGSVHSSYREYSLDDAAYKQGVLDEHSSEADIDAAYDDIAFDKDTGSDYRYYINTLTGEVIMNKALSDKLTSLIHIDNANTVDVIYDKNEWTSGDLRPENLFDCEYTDGDGNKTHYNGGNAGHAMEYDVGYNQKVRINTTAEEVFTTDVKRSADDLKNLLSKMKDLTNTMNALKTNKANTTDAGVQQNIQNEIDAAQKAFDYLREDMQDLMGRKITAFQKALDTANVAVTENGTRSKRLDMITTRLMNQVTTFKTLQSENEDIDLAETATMLSMAELTYQASLMATGKISQRSLMDYI